MKRKLKSGGSGADLPATVLDSDLVLLTAFLDRSATPDEQAEFERRYVEDDAFYEKVEPVLGAWTAPVHWRGIVEEIDAKEREAIRKSEARQTFYGRIHTMLHHTSLAYAAGIIVSLGVGYWAINELSDPGASQVTTISVPQAQGQQGARPADVSRTLMDLGSTVVTADSTKATIADFPGGSRILFTPGSGGRYRATGAGLRGVTLELKGEATVEVTRAELIMRVISRAGSATLVPGRYALRCVGACAALEVTVAEGSAHLSEDRSGGERLTVPAGGWGRAFRDGAPTRVPADSAKRFPVPGASAAAVGPPGAR